MKYNFKDITLLDLDGKEVLNHSIDKTLANLLYQNTPDLDLVTKAMDINAGKEVELDKTEIQTIITFIKSDKCTLYAFAKKSIIDFIESKKEA